MENDNRVLDDIDVFLDDIPLNLAIRAYEGTSFSPERRGETARKQYAGTLQAAYTELVKQANLGGTQRQLDEYFARFREGYKKRYLAWLQAHSNCISAMITGPANFPVRRAEKSRSSERRRYTECLDYLEKVKRKITTELRPELKPIMAGDSDAIVRLTVKLEKLEQQHKLMRESNTLMRKLKQEDANVQIKALVSIGHHEKVASELVNSGCQGQGRGYAAFELSNSNAEIRRLKQRLKFLETTLGMPVVERESDGVRLEDDPPANRVRLYFKGKPDPEVRSQLKSNGFRWTPSIGAWQAYRNHNSMRFAVSMISR